MRVIHFFFFLLLSAPFWLLSAEEEGDLVLFQNQILCRINGTSLSLMDVKKKMDILFYENFPDLFQSPQARQQFYDEQWKQVFHEMLDHELLLADAEEKEVKVSDGEVREALERRFGPKASQTLDTLGISYDEAWKIVRKELITQRMSWWFIHSKALNQVSPQDVKNAYEAYLQQNPPYREFVYYIISLPDTMEEARGREIASLLQMGRSYDFPSWVESLKESEPSIKLSSEYVVQEKDLSSTYRDILSPMEEKSLSPLILLPSKNLAHPSKKIFYLSEKRSHAPPSLEEVFPKLKQMLVRQATETEAKNYFEKLRERYGFSEGEWSSVLEGTLHPFSLKSF